MAVMALAGDNRSSTTARLRDCGERPAGFLARETRATCPAGTGGGSLLPINGEGTGRAIAETATLVQTSPFGPDALAIPRRKYAPACIIATIIAARIFSVARSSA